MTTATLNHPDISQISLPILGEGGDPLVSRDFGLPHMGFRSVGRMDPVPKSDQWNRLENYTLATMLVGSGAYSRANRLADLIKSPTNGSPIEFTPNLPAYSGPIDVVGQAEQKQALTLTYPAGTSDHVEVDLGLTRIGDLQGTQSGTRAQSPRTTGNGPIVLQDGSNRIELTTDTTVERTVGRPNSVIKRNIAEQPRYIEKRKAAYDAFAIDLTAASNPTQKVTDLIDFFRTRRGRSPVTLDFNGTFGLGQFSVQLDGSAALRHVQRSGEGAVQVIPSLDFRVVSQL